MYDVEFQKLAAKRRHIINVMASPNHFVCLCLHFQSSSQTTQHMATYRQIHPQIISQLSRLLPFSNHLSGGFILIGYPFNGAPCAIRDMSIKVNTLILFYTCSHMTGHLSAQTLILLYHPRTCTHRWFPRTRASRRQSHKTHTGLFF